MPRNHLIDSSKMTEADAALMSARLYLRGGKRRLQKGPSGAGMAALYNAILCGMRYYIAKHTHCAPFVENIDLWDAASLFHALTCAGVFDDPLAFNRFSLIVERALWKKSFSFDVDSTLAEVETILTKLGIMPSDKATLPSTLRAAH